MLARAHVACSLMIQALDCGEVYIFHKGGHFFFVHTARHTATLH